ncbi:MAG TPA: multifunctional CCA addition/repair protein [Gammaproteobacteria bacterium]|nr:multifunctional CCA addition/repair protein [Gammaproteobacteria bacterium]
MQVYLVGGAVRDELLELPVKERDWVVVGSGPEEMVDAGYTQVGRDFPVFLHPRTGEEYALARTERKTAPGYHGFDVYAGPDVTLEQDLQRRDLTINAMARDAEGRLIDPWGGLEDLRARRLRHVSPAFREDPVRILRVARFAARFAPLGFDIAPETLHLMQAMVDAGEADHLVPERVWQEMRRALDEPEPARFFQVLHECGALSRVLPVLERQYATDGEPLALRALRAAVRIGGGERVRFAALMQALGGPDDASGLEAACRALRVPNGYRELALLALRQREACHAAGEMDAEALLSLLEDVDAIRRPQRVEDLLAVCHCDAIARAEAAGRRAADAYPPGTRVRRGLAAALAVDTRSLGQRDLPGPEIGEAIRRARLDAVRRELD